MDPFQQAFINGAADRVLDLLKNVDQDRALFFARQSSLRRFDPELANVVAREKVSYRLVLVPEKEESK